ncbi:MAG: hypothetical protein GC151_06070 [Betaproteobacteria bacterium]|nr:hypothetical protein [Betaproteobacteria bacterium]
MKAIVIVAVGRLLQMVAAFFTLKLATTLMSPGQVGQINQLLALVNLFATGLVVPLVVYFARGIVGWINAGQFSRRLREVSIAVVVATLVLTPVGSVLQGSFHLVHGIGAGTFAVLFALYVFGFSLYTLTLNCVAVLGQRLRSAVVSNVAAWGGLVIAAVLFVRQGSAWYWTFGIFAGYLVAASALFAIRRTSPERIAGATNDPLSLRPGVVWTFVWPQVAMFALWWTQSQSYRFVLAEVSTVAAVGVFFAAYALVSVPMQAFEAAFNELYSPTLYRDFESQGGEGRVTAWNDYVSAYLPSIVLCGCFLAGCAPHVARIALGPAFQVGAAFFVWPALSETFRAMSSVNHTLGVARIDMRWLLPPAFAGAVTAPLLVFLLSASSPVTGTGQALCAASAVVLVAVYGITRMASGARWPWRRIAGAGAAGAPMVLAGVVTASAGAWSPLSSIAACGVMGVYALGMIWWFARPWLGRVHAGT